MPNIWSHKAWLVNSCFGYNLCSTLLVIHSGLFLEFGVEVRKLVLLFKWSYKLCKLYFASVYIHFTTTTTKPFVPSIWGRLHEPKENYAGSGTWISFLHSFLSSNMPSLRLLASISCRITSIHVFFSLSCALLTCPI